MPAERDSKPQGPTFARQHVEEAGGRALAGLSGAPVVVV